MVLALAAMPVLSAVASTDSATLFGRVTAADTGAPLVDVLVGVVDSLGNFVAGTTTAANGTYEIGDLPAGDYHLIARHGDGYVRELHQGIHCLPAGLSPDVACGGLSRGTLVVVEAGAVVEVDFELDRGGSIEGEVAAASGGEPLLGSVTAWNSQGVHASTGSFVLEGSYSLEGLPSGTYYARAEGSLLETGVLVDELYDDRLCPPPGSDVCDPIAGDPIEVTLGDVTGGIDFVLGRLGSISGQVRSAATGELLPAVVVSLYDVTGRPIQSVGTGEPDGEFEFLVRRGTYYLAATGNAYSLADELYEDLQLHPVLVRSARGHPDHGR